MRYTLSEKSNNIGGSNDEGFVKCHHCQMRNYSTDVYCCYCGKQLLTNRINGPSGSKTEPICPLSQKVPARIVVAATNSVYRLGGKSQFTLGRSDLPGTYDPDIDLSEDGAMEAHVSQIHATIEQINGLWFIKDENSANHTYVNGEQILPSERRVLSDGDRISLGDLLLYFYHI